MPRIHIASGGPKIQCIWNNPGGTVIGPVVAYHVVQFLGTHGIEIEIPSPNRAERTSWVMICQGKNRYVDELHIQNPEYNLASSEFLT